MYAEVYETDSGGWRWRLKAENHEIVAQGEEYTERQSAMHGLGLIVQEGDDITHIDIIKREKGDQDAQA